MLFGKRGSHVYRAREDKMLKILQTAVVAVATTLLASTAMAQVNLVSNVAGAGTAGGLSATGVVEVAAQVE